MNPIQRLVGLVGVVCIILVAIYPAWIIEGRARYDYNRKYEDNERTDQFSEETEFCYEGQDRGFLFAQHGVPEIRYMPSPVREFEEKKGYVTVECINVDVPSYSYSVDTKRMMLEFFVVLIPTLLLMLVFMKRRDA